MAERAQPPIARWHLCKHLRQARNAAGLSQRKASFELGWSPSKLLRIENGKVGLGPTDCQALLNLYAIDDEKTRAKIKSLATQTRFAPWKGYADVLASADRRFLVDESSAVRVRVFEPMLMPELLRTHQYARTLAQVLAPGSTSQQTDLRMSVLRARHDAIFNAPDPAELHFVVDETALVRLAAEPDAVGSMIDGQVAHLRELAARPTISIQILPVAGGAHPGLGVGPFALLEFDHSPDSTLLYLRGGQRPVVDDPGQIARYTRLFAELAAAASPPDAIGTILDRHVECPDLCGHVPMTPSHHRTPVDSPGISRPAQAVPKPLHRRA